MIRGIPDSKRRRFLALVILIPFALLLGYNSLFQRLDLVLYDLYAGLFLRPPSDDIRIVAIDERSIAELGRWPWSRRVHGELIRMLTSAGVRAIGLDIIFSEPDLRDPESDRILADAIESSGRVVLPVFPSRNQDTRQLEEAFPLTVFGEAAAMLGHVDAELDVDGISRSVFLKAGLNLPRWPVLPLAMLQLSRSAHFKTLPGQRNSEPTRVESGTWLRDHRILIPFAGPSGHFKTLSYADVLQGAVDKSDLEDKWVLIGATAIGLGDRLSTPTSGQNYLMPGVEYNANILDTLLQKIAIKPLGQSWQAALTLLPLCLMLVLYLVLPPGGTLAAWILMILSILAVTVVMLARFHLWFAPASALILVSLSYPLWLWGSLSDALSRSSAERDRTQASYDALDQSLVVIDPECRVEYMSPSAERLTGYKLEQIQGLLITDTLRMIDDEGNSPFSDDCDETSQGKNPTHYLLTRPDGDRQLVWINARTILDRMGHQRGWMIRLYDRAVETAAGRSEEESLFFDPLTGLPNRSLLVSQLEQNFLRAERGEYEIALLFVNLDRFRQINDRLGYHEGDQLLQQAARRLRESIRESDILARNGSDEFVVVLEDLSSRDSAGNVAGKIVERLSSPYQLDGQSVSITASIGISLYPWDGKDTETLLNKAYVALRSRRKGDSERYSFFSREMHEQVRERHEIERRLALALARNQFEIHYQPQIEIATGRIVGAEALLRWRDSEDEYIPPAKFIPVAEESGLIHQIGGWVFETVIRHYHQWRSQGLDSLRISVNLSAVQLERNEVMSGLLNSLKGYQLESGWLDLEITESAIMRNVERSTELLQQFQAIGGSISVDDFGTGYSTFGYLKQLPVNRLKIDRSFVRDMTSFQDDAIITLTIISMAHGLNLEVIAEGVETPEQLAILKEQGCDLAQGYLIARPLPAKDFAALVRNWPGQALRNTPVM